MHGQSRLAYHGRFFSFEGFNTVIHFYKILGVPKILENSLPKYLQDGDEEWESYKEYLKDARININVRQVF